MKSIGLYLLLMALGWGLIGCQKMDTSNFPRGDRPMDLVKTNIKPVALNFASSKLSETEPPSIIQELNKSFEPLLPQVALITPPSDRIYEDTTVSVKLQVKNLEIFKDEKLGMGPHLNLILDNEPVREIYDLDEPIILENLTPGTHTIRVFAARPWQESFKNEGAYAQTTFHVLTKTNSNNPDPDIPLITYSHPTGNYSAEPIMLDFYLTNAPLHLVAKENPNDNIKDWHIRITVNGESFMLDDWQPIYLQGFNQGNNWIQLELLDEDGNNIENAFNNTVRLVNYHPKQSDTLGKLVTGKISLADARSIVKQDYDIQSLETQEVIESEPTISEEPEVIESEPTISEEPEIIEPEPTISEEPEIIEPKPTISEEPEDNTTTEITPQLTATEAIAPAKNNIEIVEEATKTVEIVTKEAKSTTAEPQKIAEIPDVEAITITEDEIAIETSPSESEVASQPATKFNFGDWIKNLWSNIQRKAQNVVQAIRE
ncbi:MAG: hypothetical protein ACFCU5_02725 [Pleurocapsa sp.]